MFVAGPAAAFTVGPPGPAVAAADGVVRTLPMRASVSIQRSVSSHLLGLIGPPPPAVQMISIASSLTTCVYSLPMSARDILGAGILFALGRFWNSASVVTINA